MNVGLLAPFNNDLLNFTFKSFSPNAKLPFIFRIVLIVANPIVNTKINNKIVDFFILILTSPYYHNSSIIDIKNEVLI